MDRKITNLNGEVFTEGKDFVFLELLPDQQLNVKVEGIETYITSKHQGFFSVQMKSKEHNLILSYQVQLYFKVLEVLEQKKEFPFFLRIIGGSVNIIKGAGTKWTVDSQVACNYDSFENIRGVDRYQEFKILG